MINLEQMKPIEAENIESHEEELRKRLQIIQLSFADRKFSEEKEKNPDLNFLDILEKYTSLKSYIENEYEYRNVDQKNNFEEFWLSAQEEIKKIYENKQDGWEEKIMDLMMKKVKSLGPVKSDNFKKERAGLLNYRLSKDKMSYEKFGVERFDFFIEIHFDEAYIQNESGVMLSIRKSFKKLASDIVEKHPETKYVIGRSWILDHSISKKLGFEIVERTDSLDHFPTWWQLMDKNGQISQKRMQQFLEKGKLPYQVALGIIPVEKFLNMYLPDEKRGKIKLKEIGKEDREKLSILSKKGEIFKEKFKQMSNEEMLDFFKGLPYLGENLEAHEIKEYFDFLCEIKDDGIGLDEVDTLYPERMEIFKNNIEGKYMPVPVEKEIFIEPRKK